MITSYYRSLNKVSRFSHMNRSSPLLSVTSNFFLQQLLETFHVLLYHVSPLLLLSSSTSASVDLYCHNSFHGVFVLSSHHMTVPSQSGLLHFVSDACHSKRPFYYLILSLIPQRDSKYPP